MQIYFICISVANNNTFSLMAFPKNSRFGPAAPSP
jgi:hypothetical protein